MVTSYLPITDDLLVSPGYSDHYGNQSSALTGGGIVSWSNFNMQILNYQTLAQMFNAAGQRVGGVLTPSQGGVGLHVGNTGLADGTFVVYNGTSGASPAPEPSGYQLHGQRYDSNAQPLGLPFAVERESLALGGDFAQLGSGFVAAYRVVAATGDNAGLAVQRYSATGSPLGDEVVLATSPNAYPLPTAIEELPDGGFVVAWYTIESGSFAIYGNASTPAVPRSVASFPWLPE